MNEAHLNGARLYVFMRHAYTYEWGTSQHEVQSISRYSKSPPPPSLSSFRECVAVCCSVLQCVAVCCSVWQCVAVCCSVLRRAAVCCSVLQCIAVCSVCCSMLQNVLQYVAVWCSELQCVAVVAESPASYASDTRGIACNNHIAALYRVLQGVAVCCSVHQCVAVCCSVLQCVAVCCSVLQLLQCLVPRITCIRDSQHSV